MQHGTLETTYTFRNMDPTDALRDYTAAKLSKLDKYLFQDAKAHVIFNLDKAHIAEITLHVKGKSYVGHEISNDMYTSVDGAVDKLKKQMGKTKERIKGHKGE